MTPGARRRWRPRLRTVLLSVHLVILVLPLAGIAALRLYENQLVRQTEAELIAQGAVAAAVYRDALRSALADNGRDLSSVGFAATDRLVPEDNPHAPLTPVEPRLDVGVDAISPPTASPVPTATTPDPAARAAGEAVERVLHEAKNITLSGILVVDPQGVIVASTRSGTGESIAHWEEVQIALRGAYASSLRERQSQSRYPKLDSISRAANIRVFVALPVLDGDRVVGAVVLSRTPKGIAQALYEFRFDLLAFVGLVVAVVLVVSLLTSARISRPIQALVEQTEAVRRGAPGSREPLARPGTRDIATLSEAVASMARTLEERAAYVRSFASAVSHELKSPLTAIQGAVELLREHLDEMTPDERERFLRNLDEDARRLERMVARLLELARAEVTEPRDASSDPVPVLERLAGRFGDAGLVVELDTGPRLGSVPMAEAAFETVVATLLDNALQHAGRGARVELSARREVVGRDAVLVVRVRDDGPGVAEEHVRRVFEPFFSTTTERGGTGIGLSIAHAILTAHGGRIALEAPTAHPGAEFVVTVPYPSASI